MRMLTAVAVLGAGVSVAGADLIEYAWAPGLVYDDDVGITWLKDASLGGVMDWYDAHTYADGFSVEIGGVTYEDWRLPMVWSFTTGPNVVDGEMGFLHLEYGITSDAPGPFDNLMPDDYWYDQQWTSTQGLNFSFHPLFIGTWVNDKDSTVFSPRVMLVFDGAPVPTPGVLAVGVCGLVAMRRRR